MDPEESPYYYTEVISALYYSPPTILNSWLERDVPLRPRQLEGVIIAHGYVSVPRQCHDETLVPVELLLRDERYNELSFAFAVRVDRSVMRKCERQGRERRELALKRSALFQPKGLRVRDQKSVARQKAIKQPHVRDKHDATGGARTSDAKPGNR